MSKALYREYRPKSLEDVVGQEHITNTLKNALKNNSISHAYLLTGPRGVGKTSVARILAYEINEISYNDGSTHLDIIEIDAASNRRIDEIRELRDKINIMPTSAKYKVYIIDEVHMLTREAFNALLKTLEEPPEHVVFILATTEVHKVPDTIISRTQRYSFKPVEKEKVISQLELISKKEKIKITTEALGIIAEHGKGSFRDSISMLDQVSSITKSEITLDKILDLLGIPNDEVISEIIDSVAEDNAIKLFDCVMKLREKGANPANTAQKIIQKLKYDLINGENKLNSSRSIKVMKSLLPLTGTNSEFEAVEIALLDCMNFLSNSNNEKIKDVNHKSSKHPQSKAEVDELKVNSKQPILIADLDKLEEKNSDSANNNHEIKTSSGSWNNVLNTLKNTHNTLYGVLRMAETVVEEDKIILVFQFEFHKKQLEQTKNMNTLKNIVDQHLGSNYDIRPEVRKRPTIKTVKGDEGEIDTTLGSVSNIFGGAELLES